MTTRTVKLQATMPQTQAGAGNLASGLLALASVTSAPCKQVLVSWSISSTVPAQQAHCNRSKQLT